MKGRWFKPRGYKHLDAPVGEEFAAKTNDPRFVAQHGWTPLIHYIKAIKRYKPVWHKTVVKNRPIMFASHRDACILSRYAHELSALLDEVYAARQSADRDHQ